MARQQSEIRKLISQIADEMLDADRHSLRDMADEVLRREEGLMDDEADRWKRDSVIRMLREYLKRNSAFFDDPQPSLDFPEFMSNHPPPSTINVTTITPVMQDGVAIEVIDTKWVPSQRATIGEWKRYSSMLGRGIAANINKKREIDMWIDYFESEMEGNADEVVTEEIMIRLRERLA